MLQPEKRHREQNFGNASMLPFRRNRFVLSDPEIHINPQ
jgi:hypothetical protein